MNVRHEAGQQAFTVDLDGDTAELTYARPSDGVVEFNHTFVPESGRDKGIASAMAKSALAWAREQGLKVVPVCPYVAAYVKKHHAEYADILK